MFRSALLAATAACWLAAPASAATITWTTWNAAVTPINGQIGVATGTAGGIGVTYTGNLFNVSAGSGLPTFKPVGSYSGGTVGNAPPDSYAINLAGGARGRETIHFSTAVVNPIFAFWSLGQPSVGARFIFEGPEPVSFQGGGPGQDFGGSAITVAGNVVTGNEGNGVVQITGTVTDVNFTTPDFEYYYAFTVGYTSLATVVPEPMSVMLLGTGLVGLGVLRRKRSA